MDTDQRTDDHGPYEPYVGGVTRSGREFWVGIVATTERGEGKRATATYAVLREDGFRSSKF